MICKKEEAQLAIDFLSLPSGNKFKETPEWLLRAKEDLYIKCKQIKVVDYEKEIVAKYKPKEKIKKKEVLTNCPSCDKVMNQFHSNGIKRITCSRVCRSKYECKVSYHTHHSPNQLNV